MSIYETILDQVRAAVDALPLSGSPIVLRRKTFSIQEKDPKYLIVVSPRQESEQGEDEFENCLFVDYPVLIGITTGGGNLLDGDTEDLMLTYREKIRIAVRSVLTVAPGHPVMNVSVNTKPVFDRPALRDNRDVSAIEVTYTIQEPRNT